MPSVYSRLAPYLTPSWILVLLSGFIAFRLACRSYAGAMARAQLGRSQAAKRARMQGQMAAMEAALEQTAAQRSEQGRGDIIVKESATTIVQKLSNGTYSARLVLHSILARLSLAQSAFNVLSEANFTQALADAEAADKVLADTGRPIGRLHGLPISLKDSVNVAGLDTTLGLCRFAGQPASADALIVQLLKKQGALIHAKSNIPQTLLSFECVNPLHGRTLNPFNKKLTPGGSSGGESALLACGASVVGIGTDIGGSVRIPAHFSGQAALKPTARRLSLQGFRPSVPGQEAIPAVAGPMAQHVEDLVLVLRELWTPEAWSRDADLVPVAFDEPEVRNNAKLKVGYYIDDGFVAASPACQRAVLEAVDALRKDGHSVTEFKPPRIMDLMTSYYGLITSDNCNTLGAQLVGEIWEDYCSTLITGVRLPYKLKQTISWILRNLVGDSKAAAITAASRERTVSELWAMQSDRKKLRQDFFDAWSAQGEFDVVLTPVHVLPAVPHGAFKTISFTCSYTLIYNVLDLPAGVLPITVVDSARDAYPAPPKGLLEKAARKHYVLPEQHGLPLGVQVVGKPFKDETVLRAMRIIEGLVQFKQPKINL